MLLRINSLSGANPIKHCANYAQLHKTLCIVGTGRPAYAGPIVRIWRVFTFKVLGAETIQTPAGTLGAFKIEESSYETECRLPCETLANTTVVRHLWYAPEVKFPVKAARVRRVPTQEQEPDYELVAFELKWKDSSGSVA